MQLELFNLTNERHLLTTHEGEYKRLFKFKGSNLDKAQKAAKKSGAIILLKGTSSIIAHPDGRTVINITGTPYLATAGSGDVLSGIIAGLIAQGMAIFDAACAGAWIHGKTAEYFGPGLIAEDICDLVPKVIQEIAGFQKM